MDPIIHHFSHQHPLKLVNFRPETTNAFTCAGCKLEASGWFYFCTSCNYCLHKTCSYMPRNKVHRADPKHALVLLSSPVYATGSFKCNACGKLGTGFCYHCRDCQIDIHTLCIYKPSSVNISIHHHSLELCFSPPYSQKKFQCDICKKFGSNHWLYRCSACNYDVHMNCAMSNRLQPAPEIQMTQILHPTDTAMSNLPFCRTIVANPDPQHVAGIHQIAVQSQKLHNSNSANFHIQPIGAIQVQQTHQEQVTDNANRYAQTVTSIQQAQQQPQLLKSQSFPPRFPKFTADLPRSEGEIYAQYVRAPNPIGHAGSSNWGEAYKVYDRRESMPAMGVVPQYAQLPCTTNVNGGNNLMGHVVEELIGGFFQHAGGAIFDSLASGDLPFDLNIGDS